MFASLARLSNLRELKLRSFGFDTVSLDEDLKKPAPVIICRNLDKFSLQLRMHSRGREEFKFNGRIFCEIFSKIYPKLLDLSLLQVPRHPEAQVEPHLYLLE